MVTDRRKGDEMDYSNESAIRAWLAAYMGGMGPAEKMAEIDCIMAQDNWRYIDANADRYAGAQFEPGPGAFAEGIEYAISALYECHDGPHRDDCPSKAYEMNVDRMRANAAADARAGQFYMVQVYQDDVPLGDPLRICPSQFADWESYPGLTMDVFQ
jgi:hypothetical protein